MAMSDLRPKWAIVLDELIEMAEQELKDLENGAVPTAQKHEAMHTPHLAKVRGDNHYE
jgi:hypothetical protein